MKNSKNFSTRKIALGTSSALLATLIAVNGTGLAQASETQHHSNNPQTTHQNSQNTLKKTQNKTAFNENNYMDKNFDLRKRCFALLSAAEDSDFDYSKQYGSWTGNYGDGRGYTAGLVGFTTGTGDMYKVIKYYNQINPDNPLSEYEDKLKDKKGGDVSGLDGLKDAWKDAYKHDQDNFIKAQNKIIKEDYYDPAIKYAKKDGLSQLGSYIYFDAMVKHGPGEDKKAEIKDASFGDIRRYAQEDGVKTPANGGDEKTYLSKFVEKNIASTNAEKEEEGEDDSVLDRLKFQQEQIDNNNFDLKLPLEPKINGMNSNGEKHVLNQEFIDGLNDQHLDFENA